MASWSFGKVLTMSFLHTAVMSPTPAGLAQSFDPVTQEESWQLLAATLILFLSVSCDVVMTEVRWPTFQMTNNHSYPICPQLSMYDITARKRCECCGSESDLDSPTLWFIITEMRRGLYNVCSIVQCTLGSSARNCEGQVCFMPSYHAIFTHLHMPPEWSSSMKAKEKCSDYRYSRWQFY